MKKKTSIIACLVLMASIVEADVTIELKEGWNLVGYNKFPTINVNMNNLKNEYNLSNVLTYQWASTRAGEQLIVNTNPTNFEPGTGYWIKSNIDQNITINTTDNTYTPNLRAGWNLVVLNQTDKNQVINNLSNLGLKVDSILTYEWASTRAGEQLIVNTNPSIFSETQGYWVKVEKLAGVATTRDGYDVKLYVDSENADVSTLVNTIPNYFLTELSNIQNLFSDVSNIVVSGTNNGQVIESSYIDPTDSSFATVLNNAKNSIDNPTLATSGTSIYVYGLSEGGAPYILSEANVYRLNSDGTKGEFLGTTSQTGYLYLSDVQDGMKVIVEKDGFDSSIQTLNVVSGGANYIFLSEDDGAGVYEGTATTTNTASDRLINRVLNAWNAQLYRARDAGAIISPVDSRLKMGAGLKVRRVSFANMPDYNYLDDNIMSVAGYETYMLGSMKVYGKAAGSYAYRIGIPFNDIFETQNGVTINDIEAILSIKLNDTLKEKLLNDRGQYDIDKISNFKNNIVVYQYKNNSWQEINSANISLKLKDAPNVSFTAEENSFLSRYSTIDGLIVIDGSAYTGAYPLVAIYKEAVNTTPDITYHTYGLNVKVTETNGSIISNAMVKMSRGAGGHEVISYTDANGIAHFDILAADGAIDTISLNVIEGSHYPVSRVLNLSSLNADNNTTITLSMETPPAYATVKGTVNDSQTNNPITNAKVTLVYPIALADVKKDVEKIIDNKVLKGISVGLVPNAKYKWYIKAHEDTTDTTLARTLNRVSTQRWILVQEATAADNGNFLPYSKIVGQALAAPRTSDPSDIQIIPTGQFDIAVEVEHDIDADGNYDFVELAATDANLSNLSGEEFDNANNNYGRTLGYVSTSIDINKIIENSGGAQYNPNVSYIKADGLNNSAWEEYEDVDSDTYNELVSYSAAAIGETSDDDGYVTVGDNFNFYPYNSYLFVQDDTNENAHDYNYTRWDIAISATLKGNSSDFYVALQPQSDGTYKWVALDSNSLGNINPVRDEDKFIFVQQDTFKGISYDKIGRIIAQNKIFAKLAMKLSDIAIEAGLSSSDLQNPDNPLFEDGFNVSLIPTMVVTTNEQAGVGAGKEIDFRKIISIGVGGVSTPIRDYIKLDQVLVDRPVLTQSSQTTHTDRVGLYQFSAVPLSYGELNNQESLLRVESNKLGYYSSGVVNVPKFESDNPATSEREDVQRIDLTMSQKQLYNVEVNVTDINGDPINDAVIIIDGIVNDNTDLTESDSIQAQQGSLVTFNNVIGGRGSTRIIRVSVPDSNYIPVIKTIRNLDSDTVVNVQLQITDQVADYAPSISIVDSNINYNTGIAQITVQIVDKNDGTTTVTPANIYVRNNNDIVNNATINQDGNKFVINVPLNIGQNDIVIEAGNTVGITRSNHIMLEFDADRGSISGVIRGFTDNNNDGKVDDGEMLVLDIFNEEGLYINTAFPNNDGRYILEDLRAGEQYKLQALEINLTNGSIIKKTDFIPVTVNGGVVVSQDFTLSDVPHSIVTGSPVIDLIGDLTQEPISSNGEINVSFTLSNFDKNNGLVGIVVNDRIYDVKNALNEDPNNPNTYNVQNYPVQLRPGNNIIYVAAQNPDGSYDWSADVQVYWNASNNSATLATLNINLCDTNCSQAYNEGATIEIYDNQGYFVNSVYTDDANESLNNLMTGNYIVNIYPNSPEYMPVFDQNITLNSGSNELNVTLIKADTSIDIPDFYVSSIDINSTSIEVNKTYTATAYLSTVDTDLSGYTYHWYYETEDGNSNDLNCSTYSCEFSIPVTGWVNLYVDVTKAEHTETGSTGFTVQEIVLPEPPSFPNLGE